MASLLNMKSILPPLVQRRFKQIEVPYNVAVKHILDGDLVFYRAKTAVTRLVRSIGRTEYYHVGMLGWDNGSYTDPDADLMVYELRWTGGQGSTLLSHCEKWPGTIDVYRLPDTYTLYGWDPATETIQGNTAVFNRKRAVSIMRDFCRPGEYGRMHLVAAYLANTPILRLFFSQPIDDELEDRARPPHCSEAVAYAIRKAFTDIVRATPDTYTQPGDLGRSPILHYMFTLIAPTKEAES